MSKGAMIKLLTDSYDFNDESPTNSGEVNFLRKVYLFINNMLGAFHNCIWKEHGFHYTQFENHGPSLEENNWHFKVEKKNGLNKESFLSKIYVISKAHFQHSMQNEILKMEQNWAVRKEHG